MTLLFSLSAKVIHRAQLHQSDDPTRLERNGINISPLHAVATDGHTLYLATGRTDKEEIALGAPADGVTVQLAKRAPKLAEWVEFHSADGKSGQATFTGKKKSGNKVINFEVIALDFPKWQNITGQDFGPVSLTKISFGGALLARVGGTYDAAVFEARNGTDRPDLDPWNITGHSWENDVPSNIRDRVIIMPMRID